MAEDPFNLKTLSRQPAPPDLWPAIEGRLNRQNRPGLPGWRGWALAASVTLALGAVLMLIEHPAPADPAARPLTGAALAARGTNGAAEAGLDQWQRLSAHLERQLAAARGGVVRAADLPELTLLESELRLTDELLSERPKNPQLWQQRARLLSAITVRYRADDWDARLQPTVY